MELKKPETSKHQQAQTKISHNKCLLLLAKNEEKDSLASQKVLGNNCSTSTKHHKKYCGPNHTRGAKSE